MPYPRLLDGDYVPTSEDGNTAERHSRLLTATQQFPAEVQESKTSGLEGTNQPTIVRRYLTFDTVPPPLAVVACNSTSERVPPRPDLTKFTDPLGWPKHRKQIVLALSCVATALTAYASGSYAPPIPAMADDFDTSETIMLTGITTFTTGFALSPMVLAPVSEIYGRRPVLLVAGLVFVVFQAVCSVVTDTAGMLVARLMVGIGGSVFSSVIGGVIADLWTKEDRNVPMALFSGFVLGGTGAGPLIGSVIVKYVGQSDATLAWKWVFWHQVIADAVLLLCLYFWFGESRGSVLLSQKAKVLNKWHKELEGFGLYSLWIGDEASSTTDGGTNESNLEGTTPECSTKDVTLSSSDAEKLPISGRPSLQQRGQAVRLRWCVKEDEERASLSELMKTSLVRPFYLLFAEPVVFFFSLWCAFAWAILYCTFGSIPLALSRMRGMDVEESGRFFGAMIVGSAVATTVGIYQDRLLRLRQWRADKPTPTDSRFWGFIRRRVPAESPESRLYFTCITAILLPAGLFVFGFTVLPEYHWMGPAWGIGLATWGIFSVYLATFNYFADIYGRYASSALAAQSCCRNLLGGAFPLVTGALFRNLGEARAGALLGGIATVLTVIPWTLVFFGERIRARSKFAISLESHK